MGNFPQGTEREVVGLCSAQGSADGEAGPLEGSVGCGIVG